MSNGIPVVEGERYYGGSVTTGGRNLITSLITGGRFRITKVVVGSGLMPEGVEPIDMTELVEPRELATSSEPIMEDGSVSLIVEYRTDLNGGLATGFWIREFGIYAETDNYPETLIYYATLGNSPQPVSPYRDNRVDIRRYPVTIEMFVDAAVEVAYKPGAFVTSKEAKDLLNNLVQDTMDEVLASVIADNVTIPTENWELKPDGWYELELPHKHAVSAQVPHLSLSKESQETATECGLCGSCETTHGAIRLWSKSIPPREMQAVVTLISETTPSAGYVTIPRLVIPSEGWVEDGAFLRMDIRDRNVLASHIPNVSFYRDSMETAVNCGIQPSVETLPGYLRFWSTSVPEKDILVSVVLFSQRVAVASGSYTELPIATADSPGVIMASDTVLVDGDGTAHAVAKTASSEQVDEVLREVFEN